jgi:Cu+-exporting ATPase
MIKYAMVLGMAAAMPFGATAADKDGTCPASGATAGACPAGAEAKGACCATTAAKDTCTATKTEKLAKVEYKVTGMSCTACEDKVTKAVAKLDGVSEPSACSKSGKAVMAIDAKKVKDAQLVAAIEQAGFKVEGEKLTVKVDGLKCEACASKVSQAVASVKGAKAEGVCHESGQAVVSFDPKKVSRDQIIAAIDNSGFKVVQ